MRKVGVSPSLKVEFILVFQIPVVAHMKFTRFTHTLIARFCKDERGKYMSYINLQNTKEQIRLSSHVFRKL